MNRSDLKQIGDLIDKKFDVKLKPVHQKLDRHEIRLNALTVDMHEVLSQTRLLKDIHQNTKQTASRVDTHEGRIEKLEVKTALG